MYVSLFVIAAVRMVIYYVNGGENGGETNLCCVLVIRICFHVGKVLVLFLKRGEWVPEWV